MLFSSVLFIGCHTQNQPIKKYRLNYTFDTLSKIVGISATFDKAISDDTLPFFRASIRNGTIDFLLLEDVEGGSGVLHRFNSLTGKSRFVCNINQTGSDSLNTMITYHQNGQLLAFWDKVNNFASTYDSTGKLTYKAYVHNSKSYRIIWNSELNRYDTTYFDFSR